MSQPIPDSIHSLMQDLAAGLHSVLGSRLIALYLGGSLTLGDFCEASSDLDFLAVTQGRLSPEEMLAIGMLHNELLERHPNAIRLEGDYAPLEVLVPTGTTVPVPGCEHGLFLPKVGEIMLSADNIYNIRENGIEVVGPKPREILPPVTPDQVRAAVRAMLMDGPGPCGTAEEAAQGILNLCRSLCTLENGRPATKTEGAAWALERLEPRWHPMIARALAIRKQGAPEGQGGELCAAALELDRYVRSRFH